MSSQAATEQPQHEEAPRLDPPAADKTSTDGECGEGKLGVQRAEHESKTLKMKKTKKAEDTVQDHEKHGQETEHATEEAAQEESVGKEAEETTMKKKSKKRDHKEEQQAGKEEREGEHHHEDETEETKKKKAKHTHRHHHKKSSPDTSDSQCSSDSSSALPPPAEQSLEAQSDSSNSKGLEESAPASGAQQKCQRSSVAALAKAAGLQRRADRRHVDMVGADPTSLVLASNTRSPSSSFDRSDEALAVAQQDVLLTEKAGRFVGEQPQMLGGTYYQGKGKLTVHSNDTTVEGTWEKGVLQGRGTVEWKQQGRKNTVFKGNFSGGLAFGSGTLHFGGATKNFAGLVHTWWCNGAAVHLRAVQDSSYNNIAEPADSVFRAYRDACSAMRQLHVVLPLIPLPVCTAQALKSAISAVASRVESDSDLTSSTKALVSVARTLITACGAWTNYVPDADEHFPIEQERGLVLTVPDLELQRFVSVRDVVVDSSLLGSLVKCYLATPSSVRSSAGFTKELFQRVLMLTLAANDATTEAVLNQLAKMRSSLHDVPAAHAQLLPQLREAAAGAVALFHRPPEREDKQLARALEAIRRNLNAYHTETMLALKHVPLLLLRHSSLLTPPSHICSHLAKIKALPTGDGDRAVNRYLELLLKLLGQLVGAFINDRVALYCNWLKSFINVFTEVLATPYDVDAYPKKDPKTWLLPENVPVVSVACVHTIQHIKNMTAELKELAGAFPTAQIGALSETLLTAQALFFKNTRSPIAGRGPIEPLCLTPEELDERLQPLLGSQEYRPLDAQLVVSVASGCTGIAVDLARANEAATDGFLISLLEQLRMPGDGGASSTPSTAAPSDLSKSMSVTAAAPPKSPTKWTSARPTSAPMTDEACHALLRALLRCGGNGWSSRRLQQAALKLVEQVLTSSAQQMAALVKSPEALASLAQMLKSCRAVWGELLDILKLIALCPEHRSALATGMGGVMPLISIMKDEPGAAGNSKADLAQKAADIVGLICHDSEGMRVAQQADALEQLFLFVKAGRVALHRDIPRCEIELHEEVGRGSYASVYRAKWRPRGTVDIVRVAAKVFDCQSKLFNIADFRLEVAVMSLVQHPNIIAMYGAVCDGKPDAPLGTGTLPLYAMVTEYMDKSLRAVLDEQHAKHQRDPRELPGLAPGTILRYALQVAGGMAYLHSVKIIHRDLKCANLLLDTRSDTVKIADFGLSREVNLLSMTSCAGTPRWEAPECLSKTTYTTAADVYSFAMCLYEMLTSLEPYAEVKSMQELLAAVAKQRPALPQHTPDFLRSLIEDCWKKNPKKRPTFADVDARIRAVATRSSAPQNRTIVIQK